MKPEQISVLCFDEKVITACHMQLPHLTANLLVSYKRNKKTGDWSPSAKSVVAALENTGAHGFGTQAQPEVLNRKFVADLRAAKCGFHCWTVNDAAVAKQFQLLGVDSITTDRPKFIREAIASDQETGVRSR